MKPLAVATYNLQHSLNQRKLLENILLLKNQGVKVFCLQEIRHAPNGEFFGDRVLAELGPEWHARYLLSNGSRNDYGLALIWDGTVLTMEDYKTIAFPVLPQFSPLEWFLEKFILSGESEPVRRAAQVASFRLGSSHVRISNFHADWHGGLSHRLNQIQLLRRFLSNDFVGADLICGDFNSIGLLRNGSQMKKIQEILGSEFLSVFPEFVVTTYHGQHLDHIFVRHCSVESAQVTKVLGSDHFPVTATVIVPTTRLA